MLCQTLSLDLCRHRAGILLLCGCYLRFLKPLQLFAFLTFVTLQTDIRFVSIYSTGVQLLFQTNLNAAKN
jgi:hypothetical protein